LVDRADGEDEMTDGLVVGPFVHLKGAEKDPSDFFCCVRTSELEHYRFFKVYLILL
jgi:hypothetical protein